MVLVILDELTDKSSNLSFQEPLKSWCLLFEIFYYDTRAGNLRPYCMNTRLERVHGS